MDQIIGPNRSTSASQAWASPPRARVTRSAVGESSRIGVLLVESFAHRRYARATRQVCSADNTGRVGVPTQDLSGLAGSFLQARAVQPHDLAAAHRHYPDGYQPPEYLVRGGPGGPGQAGPRLLRHRDHDGLAVSRVQIA